MLLAKLNKEDVKAELRKRYGSVAAFERAQSLPEKSVSDVLRGYTNARVERAVIAAITSPLQAESEHSGGSIQRRRSHRLNAEAR